MNNSRKKFLIIQTAFPGDVILATSVVEKLHQHISPLSPWRGVGIAFGKPMATEGGDVHEIERNHELIKDLTDNIPAKPKLYPSQKDFEAVLEIRNSPPDGRAGKFEIRNY